MERNPDQILLHIGTNDLKTSKPNVVADGIVDLAMKIEESCNAKVMISELITRRDSFNQAVKAVNKRLNQFCNQHKWKIVRNSNISDSGLNRGGLHLNKVGNSLLFKNFANNLSD